MIYLLLFNHPDADVNMETRREAIYALDKNRSFKYLGTIVIDRTIEQKKGLDIFSEEAFFLLA